MVSSFLALLTAARWRKPGQVSLPEWGQRTAGDDNTSPLPTFLDKKINDIFIYKNRLGFLSDEAVILRPHAGLL